MNFPRNFKRLTTEIQGSLTALKIISRSSELLDADFDYNSMKGGLRYANITAPSRFDPSKAAAAAEKLSRSDSSLFSFEIYFEPNQNSFPASKYSSEFDRVIDFASTYGGAIITVEGHSDTMAFLRKQKEGADQLMLKKIEQSAKNLSFSRAGSVRDEIVKYASSKGITLDSNQLSVIGHGISSPKFKVPQSQNEWKQNMRVQFKIIQVEAEEDVFKPL
jgi:outer membrane protein OmpA-like peptidoglycan-associated protein